MTQREAERRERFWVYGDFGDAERGEMRQRYFELRAEPVDIADEYDTDIGTVFRVITESSAEWRKKRQS